MKLYLQASVITIIVSMNCYYSESVHHYNVMYITPIGCSGTYQCHHNSNAGYSKVPQKDVKMVEKWVNL